MQNTYIEQSEYGYFRLKADMTGELKEYYTNKYYQEVNERYTKKIDTVADRPVTTVDDGQWIRAMYEEVEKKIHQYKVSSTVTILDIGCGSGEFLRCFKENGWCVEGVEPSVQAAQWNADKQIPIFNGTIEEFIQSHGERRYNCITLNNVLEHVENPVDILKSIYNLLEEDGILYVKVPNEFNELQNIANTYVEKKEWWISIPDHINYFNLDSLKHVVEITGFEVLEKTGDFPMELFLLMDENYVDDGKVGQECHRKRKLLEMRLPKSLKEELYKKFAELGMSRNISIYARKSNGAREGL